MSGLNKAVALIFCLLLFLSSCSGNNNQSTNKPEITKTEEIISSKKVMAPVASKGYLIKNPINFKDEDEVLNPKFFQTEMGDFELRMQWLSWAATDALRDKINENIRKKIESYIMQSYKDRIKRLNSGYISALRYANFNNVLSFNIFISAEYLDSKNNIVFDRNSFGITLNLNNGEEIKLKDVFADNVDYKSVLSSAAYLELLKDNKYDALSDKVEPFSGIDDNTEFYIDENNIRVIMDYGNNFDYLDGGGIAIPFEKLNNTVAVYQRYLTGKENKSYCESAYSMDYMLTPNHLDSKYTDIIKKRTENYLVDISPKIINGAPDKVNEKLKLLQKPYFYEEFINQDFSKINKSVLPVNYSLWSDLRACGNFICLDVSIYYNNNNNYDNHYYYVIDKNTGENIPLESLFAKGFDYKSYIKNIIFDKTGLDSETVDISKDIQFLITTDGLSFVINNQNPFGINFSDIGYKNLTLFK